ncbi:hypothetical protein FXO38_06637 [Capsicum annuum]|nr:hypothetical protein FXO38_06637 [Capsicum annuum]
MDYAGVETSPQQFSPTVDQNLDENQDGTKITDDKLDDTNLSDSYSKSIIVHPSSNRELQTPIPKLRISRPSKFNESPYTMKFGSAVESSEGHIRIFPQKHPFAYYLNYGIVDTKIVNKFMDWISEDLLKVHAKRKENADHYKRGKSTIPMMHFGIETVEDKNWFYTMGFPDQSWTDSHIDVCFYYLRKKSKYDPNRSYKFSTVDCNFMNIIRSAHDVYSTDDANLTTRGQKEIDVENHPRYKDKDSSAMFDVLFQESLPQQLSGSLDCGIYIVTYTDCLSYGHKVLVNEFDPNALRTRYVALLWEYGTRKQDANAHSDVEAPLRPARQSRITSVTEVFDV